MEDQNNLKNFTVYFFNCDKSVFEFFNTHKKEETTLKQISDGNLVKKLSENFLSALIIDIDNTEIETINPLLTVNNTKFKPLTLFIGSENMKEGITPFYGKSRNELEKINQYISSYSDMINYKNKYENVLESIKYAGIIQDLIFSDEKILTHNFSEYFIYNNPKNIVSGDFYWYAKIKDFVFVAVGDCTGHGVPGAFMSVLGVTLLNEIVFMQGNYNTGTILNILREKIINSLKQTQSSLIYDGLDIALCAFNMDYDVLQYSGAYNFSLLIRDDKIIELPADKMPVGIHRKCDTDFNEHYFEFEKNDQIYLFSDGYMDQIGGDEGKKLRKRKFVDLLYENRNKTMKEQKIELINFMSLWQGSYDQIDDMLIVGLKV